MRQIDPDRSPPTPRPWSLWAFVGTFALTFLCFVGFIAADGGSIMGWVLGVVLIVQCWRGSRPALITTIIGLGIYLLVALVEVDMATSPGGHSPLIHAIEAALIAAMLTFLSLPPTRRFFSET